MAKRRLRISQDRQIEAFRALRDFIWMQFATSLASGATPEALPLSLAVDFSAGGVECWWVAQMNGCILKRRYMADGSVGETLANTKKGAVFRLLALCEDFIKD